MIRSKGDCYKVAAATTLLTCSVVVAATVLLYPRSAWAAEMTLGVTLATTLTFPISLYMANLVLKTQQLSIELRRLVDRDRLTDAATRDFFFQRMERDTTQKGVSLMIDIDHFKRINDTHGHLAGDQVIQAVAGRIRSAVRSCDIVCRFGGEEFLAFLDGCEPGEAAWIAERIRRNVAQERLQIGGTEIRVTVSVGGALKRSSDDVSKSIQTADEALYRAKAAGRNRVELSFAAPGFRDRRLSTASD